MLIEDINQLPDGWIATKLGHITNIRTGKLDANAANEDGQYPFFTCADYISRIDTFSFNTEAVLLAGNGNFNVKWYRGKFNAYQRTYVIEPKIVAGKFLYYLIVYHLPVITEQNRGSTIRYIRLGDITNCPILLPPLYEQHRIYKKLDSLYNRSKGAREALTSILPLLDKFRQSVLSSAFRGDLTADWRAQNPDIEPAEKLLACIRKERRKCWEEDELAKMKAKGKTPIDDKWKDKYKEPEPADITDLPELPEGWCWASLEELSWNSSYGTSTKCDYDATGVPVLRIPNVEAGLVNQDNLKYSLSDLSIQDEDYLSPCDFLIIRTNGSRNLIGRGALITDSFSEPTFFASYLIRFRFIKDLNLCQWLSFIWHSPIVRNSIENLASTSAGQYNINLTKLNSITLPIPPKSEIRKINFLLENAIDKDMIVSAISKSLLEEINKLDQSILAKAFRGELFPQDPNDEPASQLLERIKREKASIKTEKEKKGKFSRKKGNRKKEVTTMAKKKERRPLVEVLQPHSLGLSPEDLFKQAGFDEHLVDEFYIELKNEVVSGNIIEDRPDQERVLLRLKSA